MSEREEERENNRTTKEIILHYHQRITQNHQRIIQQHRPRLHISVVTFLPEVPASQNTQTREDTCWVEY